MQQSLDTQRKGVIYYTTFTLPIIHLVSVPIFGNVMGGGREYRPSTPNDFLLSYYAFVTGNVL